MKTTNQTVAQHSPLPWSVGGHPRDKSGTNWREILFPSPFGPAYVGQMQKEDAELCVRAVNSHADLLAALEDLLEERYACVADGAEEEFDAAGNWTCNSPASVKARAALARAKGVQP